MINKVLVNEKDLRLQFQMDRGNRSLINCIDRLNKDMDDPTVPIIMEYLQYLETELSKKYNEIDELIENEKEEESLFEEYQELVKRYDDLESENDKLIKEY